MSTDQEKNEEREQAEIRPDHFTDNPAKDLSWKKKENGDKKEGEEKVKKRKNVKEKKEGKEQKEEKEPKDPVKSEEPKESKGAEEPEEQKEPKKTEDSKEEETAEEKEPEEAEVSKAEETKKAKEPKRPKKLVQQPLQATVAKILTGIGTVLAVLFGTLAMLIFRSVFWVLKTWNNLSMEELVFHLQAPLEGTNEGMVWDFFWSCGLISIIVLIVLTAAFIILRKKKNIYYSTMMGVLLVSIAAAGLSIGHIWKELDISTYRSNQSSYSTFIDNHYVNPKDVSVQFPEQKRNLIYIFLESMENTYADKKSGGGFDKNVIPELTDLSNRYENFSGDDKTLNGGYSMPGTTWTIGAMFGQTSGLPLTIPIERNSMSSQKTFFPEIVTLGDILEKEGYSQSLMIGSDAVFGGRQLYFTEHGDYSMYDYRYAKEADLIPQDYGVWWGYEDKKLFDFAKDKLTSIAAEEEPFNFTMLTVDTHFEDGYVCTDCEDTFKDDQYANVMQCSSKKVDEFVRWIQQQDFYENTTIVISGDHPTMDSDFCDDVDEDYTRKVYTTYINSAVAPETDSERVYTTFDNFPTTLASIGASIDGNRLGLGTNLFSSTQTLSERYGYETEEREISRKSKLMERLSSDIAEEEPEEEEEEIIPNVAANIEVTPYDFTEGKFTVNVSEISSNIEIQAIRCAIWSEEDQSDLMWYEAQPAGDGTYVTDVLAKDFGYKQSAYNVYVYAIDAAGQPVLINGTTGVID